MLRTGKERGGKKDREGLGHNADEVLDCQRQRLWRKMLLGIQERATTVAMLPHEAITSLIYKSCLLAHDVEICNLVLEGLQSTFTYL